MDLRNVVAVYTDGGVIGSNPSPVGGTFAACFVNAENRRVGAIAGIVTPEEMAPDCPAITNNHTELLAALMAFFELPDGWSGTWHTDSQVTMCRVIGRKSKFKNVPAWLVADLKEQLRRLGKIKAVLVAGHPTVADLRAGQREDGMPVSEHNVFCDQECQRQANAFRRDALAG
jgi:hypothetical protein